jgi:hypothetical protein
MDCFASLAMTNPSFLLRGYETYFEATLGLP